MFEARYKKWTNGPVNQPRCQRFFFRWTRFPFEKATGDFTCGIVFFLIVYCQGEKILIRFLFFRECDIRHDRGFPQCCYDRSVGLTGHFARFQSQGILTPLHRFRRYIKHLRFLSAYWPFLRGRIPPYPTIAFLGRRDHCARFQIGGVYKRNHQMKMANRYPISGNHCSKDHRYPVTRITTVRPKPATTSKKYRFLSLFIKNNRDT